MSTTRHLCAFMAVLVSISWAAWAQDSATPEQRPADNSKVNTRDRNSSGSTADQQKENRSDRETTRQIRRAIVKDKSLSTYAHNVKVISENGMVTLKGPVRSEEEKKAVESKAAEVAGQDKVQSEIQVASKGGKKPSAVKQ
jgi:hyperosmotically inducible protein